LFTSGSTGVSSRGAAEADGIRTTMNIYSDAVTEDMVQAHEKVVRLAMSRRTQRGSNGAN